MSDFRRRLIASVNKEHSILPDGFKQYKYLTSTSNDSYIDPAISISGRSFEMRLVWIRVGETHTQSSLPVYWMGENNREEVLGARRYYGKVQWGSYYYHWVNNYYLSDPTGPNVVTDVTLSWDANTKSYTFTGSVDSITIENRNNGGQGYIKLRATNLKLMRFQLSFGGAPALDLVPCTNPEGDAGMYDLVNDDFLGDAENAGYFSVSNV